MVINDLSKLRAEIAHDLILAGKDPCIFGRPIEYQELIKVAMRFGTLKEPRMLAALEKLNR